MAQAIRFLGIIAFATLLSFGFYSQGIVYLSLFLFTLLLVINSNFIKRFSQKIRKKQSSSILSKGKRSKRKASKCTKRAKKLGLTIYSCNSVTITNDEQTIIPKLSVINGKRTR